MKHMDSLRWLHLSDLHCGQRGEKTRWPTAREPFLQDLAQLTARVGPPDVILVTGDLAFSGQRRQYEQFKERMDAISALFAQPPLWVTVPGNHDLRRPTPGDVMARGLRSYPDDAELRRAVHSPTTATARQLRKLFADYDRFFKDYILSVWKSQGLSHRLGSLPGDFALVVQKSGLSLGLVGCNSAYLQLGDDDYERRLSLEPEQVPVDLPQFVDTSDASLLLLHHPPSWLSSRSLKLFEQDIYPPGRFLACLFGHMHGHRATTELGASQLPRRYLQGSSLFGLEHYGQTGEERVSGYSFYQLARVSATEGTLSRFARTAVFLDDGALRFVDDLRTGPAGQTLTVALRKQPVASSVAAAKPTSHAADGVAPANPFVTSGRLTDPSQFVGRRELLRQLFDSLRHGGNRALVGPAQIGKSSLLSMVCALGPTQLALPPSSFVYLNLQIIDDDGDFFDALCHKLGIPPCRGYKLERQLSQRKVVLCLDEIEKLRSDRFPVEVREQLRGLSDGSDSPLTLLIASRMPLDRLFPDAPERTSPLYNIVSQVNVPPFRDEECRELLTLRLRGTDVTFTEAEVSALIARSLGHPATLVAEARALFEQHRGRA